MSGYPVTRGSLQRGLFRAAELVKQYRRRGVKTERSLNHDCIHWTVSVLLPEFDHVPVRRHAYSYLK
ncbi:hypothetical protein DRW71_18965 [Salmonella enterica subsp. diarizonae]|uniref:Uncharacterized protein n=1 Tax=Salmonella diarizonae TaxID=59204 RepID=A0A6Y5LE38_SALDZ|nr:hypothetical protein [Salmonella enterica subsp. diarizonae]EAO1751637.1 hypothetical protein [Salmonella enterica]EBV2373077.1 hypothetical protein [Salmonella enterica subsp. enterica serovar Enteritidis]ECH6753994.1 hypothetical protein [Salmonella enterica subsp. enterica serovar Newport]ECO1510206.1 hypothetical protein [Salmonella enterica subsp. arizonae]